jgi:hypothetical protein
MRMHATMGLQEELLHYNVRMHEFDLLQICASMGIIERYRLLHRRALYS